MTSSIRTATYLALGTALISGVSVFVNKIAVSGVADPILFAGFKNALVGVLLVGVVFALSKHREVAKLTRRQWGQLGLVGLVGGALPFALFFTGLSMMPAATGAMIHKTLFIWVAILAAFFLRERFSPMQWLGVATLFGANLVVGGFTGFTGSMGELLVLSATLLWAVENIIAKKVLSELSSVTVASARMIFGSLLLLIFLTVTGRISGLTALTFEGFLWTVLTAYFLFAYVLTWYAALKLAPASYVAALLVPATLVTNALSAVFVTHTLTQVQLVQGALLIAGTALLVFFAKRTDVQNETRKEQLAQV